MFAHVGANFLGFKINTSGYVRIKNYDRFKQGEPFDWDRIGSKLNGTTWIQPDELDAILYSSGQWLNSNYNALNHNCQDFVKKCLDICSANGGMSLKLLPVFRRHV